MSIDLNDNFLIHNITAKNYYEYGKLQMKLIITGMKRLFVFTYKSILFYVKTLINDDITIQIIPDNDFLKILKNIVV
jgi:hypothetical protein